MCFSAPRVHPQQTVFIGVAGWGETGGRRRRELRPERGAHSAGAQRGESLESRETSTLSSTGQLSIGVAGGFYVIYLDMLKGIHNTMTHIILTDIYVYVYVYMHMLLCIYI